MFLRIAHLTTVANQDSGKRWTNDAAKTTTFLNGPRIGHIFLPFGVWANLSRVGNSR